jgi:hypothetical protein
MQSADDHSESDQEPLREYIGYIWKGGGPRLPVRFWARNSKDAMAIVESDREGYKYSIWNEEDAARPR